MICTYRSQLKSKSINMEHIFFKMNTFSSSPYPSEVKCKTLAAVARCILSPQTNSMPTTYTQNESKEKKISRYQHSCMIVWRCIPGIHVQGNNILEFESLFEACLWETEETRCVGVIQFHFRVLQLWPIRFTQRNYVALKIYNEALAKIGPPLI